MYMKKSNTEAGGKVIEVNESDFDSTLRQSGIPVLVDFYAPWCGPCKMLGPILDSIAAEYAGRISVIKVNVDEAPTLASRFQITGVPTLNLLRGNEVLASFVGIPGSRALKAKLDEYAAAEKAAVS